MSDPDCEEKGIPSHLHTEGRTPDPVFDAEELLFRRFASDLPDLTAAIRFDRMSVNRGKFCDSAADALWNDKKGGRYEGFGVMAIPVHALDLQKPHPDQKHHAYAFKLHLEHKPEPCNYPHSEVAVTKVLPDGTEETLMEIKPKSVKLAIREALRAFITVVVHADTPAPWSREQGARSEE